MNVRAEIAKDAMTALIRVVERPNDVKWIARLAVEYADALLAELAKETK